MCNAFAPADRARVSPCLLVSYRPLGPQRLGFSGWDPGARASLGTEMARRAILALACIGAANAGSALAEGTTPLTAANFDDFVEGALAAGKTAMVRFIASEG